MFKENSESGVSLIEVMLAITLSLIILSSLIAIYLSEQKSNQALLAFNNLQENARLATQILRSRIQLAGYLGCAPNDNIKNNFLNISNENKLTTIDDTIAFWYASVDKVTLVQDMRDNTILITQSTQLFKPNDIGIISDCESSELFQVSEVNKDVITTSQALSQLFKKDSEIRKIQRDIFYVSDTCRKTRALYVRNIHKKNIELVEGVKNMKANYSNNAVAIELYFPVKWYLYVALH